MSNELGPDEANEVLRRAAELGVGGPDAPGLDRRALADAAAEVGIERRAVELALAEHDAGVLGTRESTGGVLGPSRVVETRTVPLPRQQAHDRVVAWLKGQLLVRSERQGNTEIWRPRDDLGAKVRRKVDGRIGKRLRLGELDAVVVSAAAAGGDDSIVRLEAVFDDMRRGLRTGVVIVPTAVTPALGAAAALITGEVAFALGGLPLAGALGTLGAFAGRRTLGDHREQARRALRNLLDDLEGI